MRDPIPNWSRWSWLRGSMFYVMFLLGCLVYVRCRMTGSWEHNPYAGPLICLHQSRCAADYWFSIVTLLVLGYGISLPFHAPRWWTLLAAAISLAAWVGLSITLAAWASC